MTLTFPQAATKLHQVGTAIPKAKALALKRGAETAKDAFDGVGGRLRNLGKNGTNLTARARITVDQASIKPKPAGGWAIAQSGAQPHLIGFGRGKRRVSGFIFAAGFEHPVRGPIAHPGARGRGVWTEGIHIADRVVPPVMQRTMVNETIRKVF